MSSPSFSMCILILLGGLGAGAYDGSLLGWPGYGLWTIAGTCGIIYSYPYLSNEDKNMLSWCCGLGNLGYLIGAVLG